MQKFFAVFFVLIYTVFIAIVINCCAIIFLHPLKYENDIKKVCTKFEISVPLFCSLIDTESGFNPNAKSSAGAVGLTQILPSTAQYICTKNNLDFSNFDLYNPADNLYLGAMYLHYLLNKFDDTYTALAAYNAGMGNVEKWLYDSNYSIDGSKIKTTPYEETNRYITKINNNLKIYKFIYKELKV